MINALRTAAVLAFVALTTLVLAPVIRFGVITGLYKSKWLLRLWHRTVARALGLRVHRRGTISPLRPLMLVANHVSWTDIVALGSVADVSFIAKSEMSGWPLLGWLSKLQRTVFVERERRGTSGKQADEIAGRLAGDDVMVLFAEGTTSDGNLLLPFKSTLFGAAARMLASSGGETVWIQPVALAYTRLHGIPMGRQHRPIAAWIGDEDLAPHLRGVLADPALDVEVHWGEPVAYSKASRRKEIARDVERDVAAMLYAALRNPIA